MFQEHADLPHLAIAEMFLEAGHSRHADAAFDFDIGLPRFIVGYADATEQLRGMRKHTVGNHRFGFAGEAMADGTLVLVNFCARQKIRFILSDLRIGMRLFVEVGVQRGGREFSFEWHLRRAGCHRHIAGRKIEIDAGQEQQNSQHDTQNDSLQHFVSP